MISNRLNDLFDAHFGLFAKFFWNSGNDPKWPQGSKKICLTSDSERSINTLSTLQVTSYNSERGDPYPAAAGMLTITFSVRLQGQLELFKTWIFDLNWPYWFIRVIKYTHECLIKLQFQFFSKIFEINFFICKKSLSFWNWGFQSTNIRIFWVENANCQCSDNDRVLCLI